MDDDEANEAFDAIVRGQPSRQTQLLTGVITVEDMDDEELLHGYCRGVDGKFHGGPRNVPRAVHQEIQRRLQRRGMGKVQELFFRSVEVMGEVMNDPDATNGERFNAARYVFERVAGKTPDKVEVAMEVKKYEQVLEDVLRLKPNEDGSYGVDDDAG